VLIRVGHSPDPDDAFMFWAIATGRVATDPIRIEGVAADIETLNQWALQGRLEVTALSVGAYPYAHDRYQLLGFGASLGEGYGPVVVARGDHAAADLAGRRIAVPGRMTSAYLTARLALAPFAAVQVPFDQVLDRVRDGSVDAGIVIHEGQLTYPEHGLRLVLDLGAWWREQTGLPLPLGAIGVRRDLDPPARQTAMRVLREAIELALAHRDEALGYAQQFARGLSTGANDRFVRMYVNEMTRDVGERGRAAVAELLRRGAAGGFCPPAPVEFAS
jgi:1,4-dihydroxy-6-naphthoate synthase